MRTVSVFLVLSLAITPVCFARVEAEGPTGKMIRGLTNIFTGWMEVPRNVDELTKKNDIVVGMFAGTAKGLLFTVARMIAGAVDTATFFVPPYRKPIMEPNTNLFSNT